jgi:hypothetical protein
MKKLLLIVTALFVSACDHSPATAASEHAAAAAPDPSSPVAAATARPCAPAAPFIDRVWQVRESSAVAPGTIYIFLSDGTLVIAGDKQTPAFGRWTFENDALTMIEESVAYPTEILRLNNNEFTIRSHNPGEAVLITLVPATGVPLPAK